MTSLDFLLLHSTPNSHRHRLRFTGRSSPFRLPTRTAVYFHSRRYRRLHTFSLNSTSDNDDFVTRTLEQNPSQVEPRFLVKDRFLTLKEKEALGKKDSRVGILSEVYNRFVGTRREEPVSKGKEEESGGRAVYLKDILREFKGQLYVPEQVLGEDLSEEEEFQRNVDELPKMGVEDFVKFMKADKIKLLTSKSMLAVPISVRYLDFVVDLKEIPGDKNLQHTKWTIKLPVDQARMLLDEYTGPQYEIEKHTTSYVGKLLEHPHPVASSISSRIMAELGMITAVIATASVLIGGFMASAVFAASSFLYACAAYVVWPLAKPILKIVIGLASNVAERILENIAIIISEGGLFSKLQEFYTFGGISASLTMLRPILLVLVTMVLVIRFTLSRRPKNFRKWDIWQGIEFGQSKPQARVDGSTGIMFSDVVGIDEAVEELQEVNKLSVVFIDEIDALATRRQGIFSESTNYLYNAATQERETTFNQLLIELDGFIGSCTSSSWLL